MWIVGLWVSSSGRTQNLCEFARGRKRCFFVTVFCGRPSSCFACIGILLLIHPRTKPCSSSSSSSYYPFTNCFYIIDFLCDAYTVLYSIRTMYSIVLYCIVDSFAKRYLWVTSWLYVVRRNLKSNSKLFPHVTASCVANFAPCLWQSVAGMAPPPFQEKGFQRSKGWKAFSFLAFSLPRLTVFPRAHSIKIRGGKEEGARPSTSVRICVERGPAMEGEPASKRRPPIPPELSCFPGLPATCFSPVCPCSVCRAGRRPGAQKKGGDGCPPLISTGVLPPYLLPSPPPKKALVSALISNCACKPKAEAHET